LRGYGILVPVKYLKASCAVLSDKLAILMLASLLLAGSAGCSSAPVQMPAEAAPPVAAPQPENSDQAKLREGLTGREMSPAEVADLSDRLLASGNEVSDQDMARLELVLLKALKNPDKSHRAALWRNLGIIHFNQKKYKQARQELQSANELNPKNARTRYYLARIFAQQGAIFERQGKKKLAHQQFKRAAIEMEMARKIEPSNALYRQNVKQMAGHE
jgi:tetratricopeptide (TPR) repeat protein